MNPSKTTFRRLKGKLIYTHENNSYESADVIDLAFLLKDNLVGYYGPISQASKAIQLALAMNDYASNFFAGGGVPPLALTGPLPVGPAAMKRAMEDMNRSIANARSSDSPVIPIPPGYELKQVGFDPSTVLESTAAMRGLLLTYTEKVIALEAEVDEMREDVTAYERLAKADGSLSVTETAKNLGIRPKDLFQWLGQNGWIYKRPNGGAWLGYQTKCNQGLVEHKTTTVLRADGTEKVTEQVRVTAKGLSSQAKLIHPVARLIA